MIYIEDKRFVNKRRLSWKIKWHMQYRLSRSFQKVNDLLLPQHTGICHVTDFLQVIFGNLGWKEISLYKSFGSMCPVSQNGLKHDKHAKYPII